MSSLHLKNGKVFDPSNNTFNKKRDVYINNGKIVKSLDKKATQTIDCKDKIIMPGAIDLHTHIGGGKVNIARLMLQEFHNNSDNDYDEDKDVDEDEDDDEDVVGDKGDDDDGYDDDDDYDDVVVYDVEDDDNVVVDDEIL